jgi:hypothetical protein
MEGSRFGACSTAFVNFISKRIPPKRLLAGAAGVDMLGERTRLVEYDDD